jgi:UDP-N-acetylmuramate dehydrogenase
VTDDAALAQAAAILRDTCGDRVRERFPLAALTSFRLGGPAAVYLEPDDDDDLLAAGRAVRETGIPVVVLGKGSNVLVADAGFPGLVIRLGRGYRWAARHGDELTAGGAMPLPALAGVALRHGLEGLAFGVAIPASLGGAVRMNAGAHGAEMADVLVTVDVISLADDRGRVHVAAGDAGFRYRRSGFAPEQLVVGARLRLRPGDRDAIRAAMDEAREWRRRTQPIAEPNCGSVFKNPQGDHAARLIDAAGLKGLAVGGASVSEKHANFIVAGPGATAEDVRGLIVQIQRRIEDTAGIRLEPEVQMIGAFPS